MTRAKEWRRSTFAQTAPETFDSVELTELVAGETVLRSIMSFNANHVEASSVGSPASSAIIKVGLILWTPHTAPINLPTPVSQPNADWFSMATLPWQTVLAESTNIVWNCNAHMPAEGINSQGQRKVPAGPDMSVYISWESLFAVDTFSTFTFTPVGGVDLLIEEP